MINWLEEELQRAEKWKRGELVNGAHAVISSDRLLALIAIAEAAQGEPDPLGTYDRHIDKALEAAERVP